MANMNEQRYYGTGLGEWASEPLGVEDGQYFFEDDARYCPLNRAVICRDETCSCDHAGEV